MSTALLNEASHSDATVGVPGRVVEIVREAIMSGDLAPGSPLRQEDLAQRFAAGRPPVREALKQLEMEGLITYRARRGYIVTPLSVADVQEIFEIRSLLEVRAAYFAAQNRTEADVAHLETIVQQMEALDIQTPADATSFSRMNRAFHNVIFVVSGRKMISEIMNRLQNRVERYIRYGSFNIRDQERVNDQHRQILDAFARRDHDLIAAVSRVHIQNTEDAIKAFLSRTTG
jgi:DNA-binding GntR family transcriptional regulator